MSPNDKGILDRREGKEIHLVLYDKYGFYFPVKIAEFTHWQTQILQPRSITMGEVLIKEADAYQFFIVFQ